MQTPNNEFLREIVSYTPALTRRARRLCYDVNMADDLVQETLMRAIQRHHQFRTGSNLAAWLMTILRNCFLTDMRKDKRRRAVMERISAGPTSCQGSQEHTVKLREVANALEDLPEQQRESLVMIGIENTSYTEAADRSGCSVGTIKSRVSRARRRLAECGLEA